MVASAIGPGPLGIAETRPIAEAPAEIASRASPMSAMQQTFTNMPARSLPGVGVQVEVAVLRAHDAEALAGRRLHHDPGLHLLQPLRAERLESLHLGLDVVRLDVE